MENSEIKKLIEEAHKVKEHSYSPYSHFRVGAAIKMDDDQVFTGANIENVSFGATNCAERSAIFTALSAGYKPKSINAIAVAGDTKDFLPPCSICRQVMVEFCDPETPVYLTREDESILTTSVRELVPFAFETMDM
ncbi:cytidine deaminase [Fundicoccus culcitae]|uniref:Cytidine deaminase n=1 Tax=Fundicoccus culcitae TaxID=2969821 RepID=A0ABY5P6C4_9LACT|nr:cytidine deaminase [Fundicoccus culcitae]UUX33930.1 cytidine deaminase [Fundicoccus culcitae]